MRIRQVFAILAAANLLIVAYYAGMLRGENEHLGYDIGRFEMPPNPKLYHKSILMFRRHAEAFHGYLRYGEAGQRVFLYLPPGVALTVTPLSVPRLLDDTTPTTAPFPGCGTGG